MKAENQNRIDEALQLLEDAAADEKSGIKSRINGKYLRLRALLKDEKKDVTPQMRQLLEEIIHSAEEILQHKIEEGEEIYDQTRRAVRRKVRHVEENISDDPYKYLTGTAIAAACIGYLFGRK